MVAAIPIIAELNPIALVKILPLYKSPMRVSSKDSKLAAPIPVTNLHSNKLRKLLADAHNIPPIPNISSEGIRTFFLPNRSANAPKTRVPTVLGIKKLVIIKPIFWGGIFRDLAIFGITGLIPTTPPIAINDIQMIIRRLASICTPFAFSFLVFLDNEDIVFNFLVYYFFTTDRK